MASRCLVFAACASFLAIASLPSCGGDEFASADPVDASAGQAGAAGAAGKAGAGGQAGKAGSGGALAEGGIPETGGPEAAPGTGGSAPEAGPDAPPLSACLFSGFSFTPPNPGPPEFQVHFKSAEGMICVRFEVVCGTAPATISNTLVSPSCDAGMHCWQADVSNCEGSGAQVRFYKDADNPADDTCHNMFSGKSGTLVTGCQLPLTSVDG